MFINPDTGAIYKVDGCCYADKQLGHKSLCTKCPFGDCIYYLRPEEIKMIMRAGIIRKAYQLYDEEIYDLKKVSDVIGISYTRVWQWVKDRSKIEPKLDTYAAV